MKLQVRSIVLLLAPALIGGGCIVFCTGCEDADAKQRQVVQVQIQQANLNLQKAMSGGSSEETSQALSGVVSELGQIEGGEDGQQAAKSMLSATALREIANIRLSEAENLEFQHTRRRSEIAAQVDAALRLQDAAQAMQSIDARVERAELKSDLAAARTQVTALRQTIDDFDGPISDLATINANSKQEVDALRLKVTELRRRAQELGHADGFESYEQSVRIGREADKIEFDISQREIELDYDLTPELVLTGTYADQLDSMIKAIEEADAQLEAFAKISSTQVTTTQKHVADLKAALAAALNDLQASMNGELSNAYDESLTALERAAGQAQNAVRSAKGDDGQVARLTAAQVQETLGRVHWAKARGVGDHYALVQRVASSSPGDSRTYAEQLTTTSAAHQEAIEQSRNAFASAQELLSHVQSSTSPTRIDAFGRSIDNAIIALGGTPIARAEEGGFSDDSGTPSDGLSPTEFGSAEELRNHLANLPHTTEGMRASLNFMHAETPDGMRVVKAQTNIINAMASLDEAMQAKFNQGLVEAMGPMAQSMSPDLSQATIVEETDDRVVYSVSAMGQSQRIVIRNINGRWMMDMDDMDPQTAMALPMMEQMASGLASGATDIVRRIESGELTSAEQAIAAFGQAMMGGMGGGDIPPEINK